MKSEDYWTERCLHLANIFDLSEKLEEKEAEILRLKKALSDIAWLRPPGSTTKLVEQYETIALRALKGK